MGCPERYYKKAIRCFAHVLACHDNYSLAKKMYEEKSDEIVEEFIKQKKETYDMKQFYYDAGRASQTIQDEAITEGTDACNASISGLNMFDNFIGLEESED